MASGSPASPRRVRSSQLEPPNRSARRGGAHRSSTRRQRQVAEPLRGRGCSAASYVPRPARPPSLSRRTVPTVNESVDLERPEARARRPGAKSHGRGGTARPSRDSPRAWAAVHPCHATARSSLRPSAPSTSSTVPRRTLCRSQARRSCVPSARRARSSATSAGTRVRKRSSRRPLLGRPDEAAHAVERVLVKELEEHLQGSSVSPPGNPRARSSGGRPRDRVPERGDDLRHEPARHPAAHGAEDPIVGVLDRHVDVRSARACASFRTSPSVTCAGCR